jgi:uncharacterized protein YraI
MKYVVEMGSSGTIYIPNFMRIGTGVQAILRFCLSNFRGCNVGISDGRDLRNTPLKLAQMPSYI